MAATTHHVQCTTCIVPFHALQRPPQPAAKRFTVSLHDSQPWHGAMYAVLCYCYVCYYPPPLKFCDTTLAVALSYIF